MIKPLEKKVLSSKKLFSSALRITSIVPLLSSGRNTSPNETEDEEEEATPPNWKEITAKLTAVAQQKRKNKEYHPILSPEGETGTREDQQTLILPKMSASTQPTIPETPAIQPLEGEAGVREDEQTQLLPSTTVSTLPTIPQTPAIASVSTLPTIPHTPAIKPLEEEADTTTKPREIRLPQWEIHWERHWELMLIIGILLIAGLAHGINMFHYPYIEDDEGTYMAQAWAVIHQGRLAYYTYWYDHAPVGWLQIALWALVSGGFHTFGSAIDSGRVLMLLMQIGSTWLLYRIARNATNSVPVAVIAALLFALSPFGIYFHRRVLLDNISTFWMLLSIWPLTSPRSSLNRIWLSGFALCVSILSKEVTIFLLPVMAGMVYWRADKTHRWFATIGWIALVTSLISLYPLMAIINNELFPSGTLLGGNAPHVSLLYSLTYQTSRGKDGGIFDLNSAFWKVMSKWSQDDPMLVVVGGVSTIICVVAIVKNRLVGLLGLVSLSLWAFLARGGQVLGFYLIPLLPLLALNIALVAWFIITPVKRFISWIFKGNKVASITVQIALTIVCVLGIFSGYSDPNLNLQSNHFQLWQSTQADAQFQAIQWVQEHLPTKSHIVVDEYMWPDLYDSGYTYSHYYWKVEVDPAIRDDVFHNNWRNIDYVITTDQMMSDIQTQNMTFVNTALKHGTLLKHFDTQGWPVNIFKVKK